MYFFGSGEGIYFFLVWGKGYNGGGGKNVMPFRLQNYEKEGHTRVSQCRIVWSRKPANTIIPAKTSPVLVRNNRRILGDRAQYSPCITHIQVAREDINAAAPLQVCNASDCSK